MKIVIVDDNQAMRKVLAALFEGAGHQVVASLGDGTTLAASVKEHAPDLVCLDYELPGQNGLELLAVLHRQHPDVDVLIITASADAALVGRAADEGAAGFLKKPFSQAQILEELKHVTENRRVIGRTVAESAVRVGKTGRTAVVVDDAGSMRLLMKGILEELGIAVLQTVSDGREAVAAVQRHHPDLVCLDVDMPVMTGLEALPRIREASPETRVVMVTGNAGKAFVEKAAALGAKGYLLKPVRPAQVEAFMKKLLG